MKNYTNYDTFQSVGIPQFSGITLFRKPLKDFEKIDKEAIGNEYQVYHGHY